MRFILCCFGNRSDRRSQELGWRLYSLKELQNATNNFNYDNKLGEGSFGSVYWGQLWDGSQIAVKRLKVWSSKGESEFAVEIEVLGRVRHKNLLCLRGFCLEGKERLIVYDYVPNLSIAAHLHGHLDSETQLDWERRMKITIGIAEGLAYLHDQATPNIVHRNLKSSNVMLSSEFEAQVADFGFSKLVSDTSKLKLSTAYSVPAELQNGKASSDSSSDVYSFGILLLEIVSGRKPGDKPIYEWAEQLLSQGRLDDIADEKLQGSYNEVELRQVVQIAMLCCVADRPNMVKVLQLLKKVRDLEV